ncbi:MAG TPA: hypothetical protein VEJ86_04020 [Candidatus Binataceae bacterium]|nr:hypothetical protein [Candidatus Binataceae bacterium]
MAGSLICATSPGLEKAEALKAKGLPIDRKSRCAISSGGMDAWLNGTDGRHAEVRIPGSTVYTSLDDLSE